MAEYVSVSQDALLPRPANLTPRRGRGRADIGAHGSPGRSGQGQRQARRESPGDRRIGRSRHVRPADRQGARRGGRRRLQQPELALVRSLGADRVVDYGHEDFTASGERYDAIVDLVGNHSMSDLRRALRPNGTLVMVGGSGGRWFKGTDRFGDAPVAPLPSEPSAADPRGPQGRPGDAEGPHRSLPGLTGGQRRIPVDRGPGRDPTFRGGARSRQGGDRVADSRSGAESREAPGARQLSTR